MDKFENSTQRPMPIRILCERETLFGTTIQWPSWFLVGSCLFHHADEFNRIYSTKHIIINCIVIKRLFMLNWMRQKKKEKGKPNKKSRRKNNITIVFEQTGLSIGRKKKREENRRWKRKENEPCVGFNQLSVWHGGSHIDCRIHYLCAAYQLIDSVKGRHNA